MKLADRRYFPFRLLLNGKDVPTAEWPEGLRTLAEQVLDIPFPTSNEEGLAAADQLDSKAAPGKRPEGIVCRYEGTEPVLERTVKAISNRYLLKHGN